MIVKKGEQERKQKKKAKQLLCLRFFRVVWHHIVHLLWTHGKYDSEKDRNIVETLAVNNSINFYLCVVVP